MPKGQYSPLTKEQKQIILEQYLEKPTKRLANELGMSSQRVLRILEKEGLEIPKALREKWKLSTRIKKGTTPPNKGKKITEFMTPENVAKFKSNSFKKGNKPHNTKYDGAVSKWKDRSGRTYKYIRIAEGKWELYHRYLWEQENGEIPDGHLLAFKDGDTENVSLENLELVSMIENMYRNSRHDYPDEIIPSLVLVKQLEKKLNDLER